MKRSGRTEQKISEVKSWLNSGPTDSGLNFLRRVFGQDDGLVVAAAAEVLTQWNAKGWQVESQDIEGQDFLEVLQKSFVRLLAGRSVDAMCLGKLALMRCFRALDVCDYRTVSLAAEHQQWEPVWGGSEDSAVALRSEAVHALTACAAATDHEILCALAERLADVAWPVRSQAARAMAAFGRRESAIALRLKVFMGDAEPRVMGECFISLLQLEGEAALKTVTGFVKAQAVAGEAIYALACAEFDAAINTVEKMYPNLLPVQQEQALLGLLQNRNPMAAEFILARYTFLQNSGGFERETEMMLRLITKNGRESLQQKIQALNPKARRASKASTAKAKLGET